MPDSLSITTKLKTPEERILDLADRSPTHLNLIREYLDAEIIARHVYKPSPAISADIIRKRDLEELGKDTAELFTNALAVVMADPEGLQSLRGKLAEKGPRRNGPWVNDYERKASQYLPKVHEAHSLS